MLMPGSGFFGKIWTTVKTFFSGNNKARGLLDDLKADPRNQDLAKKVKDLFAENPVAVITEVIRRVSGIKKGGSPEDPDSCEKLRRTWQNTIKKETVQPLQYWCPNNKQDLIDIVKQAEADSLMVRAVGKGHSFSDVANATDVLVSMLKLQNPLEVDTTILKSGFPDLFGAEAGMLVSNLNSALDSKGLALPTMAAFDDETIYGAVATSTHGTGLNVKGMADMVRSMDIIATAGICYRLEPSDGITDPVKFSAKFPGGEITLIQDDDKFHSAVVGFGLMGIVYSVVIEPVKPFYLLQSLWVTDWETVKRKFKDGSFFSVTSYNDWKRNGPIPAGGPIIVNRAQVFVNPYLTDMGSDLAAIFEIPTGLIHTCVVQIQTEISKVEFDKLMGDVQHKSFLNSIIGFVEEIKFNGTKTLQSETIDAEDKNSITEEISTEILVTLLNDFPLLTPVFLDISLIVLLSGSNKIGKSFIVMNQGKLAIKNAGYSVEPGFKVDEKNEYINGAEEIIRVAEMSKRSISFLTSPFCMRFVAASKDFLSPEFDSPTSMIDVPLLLGTVGDDQMLQRLQLDLLPLGARPHWGKICDLVNGESLIRQMYPKFDQFRDTVNFFNPKGTFNSSFSYRTGITKMLYKRG